MIFRNIYTKKAAGAGSYYAGMLKKVITPPKLTRSIFPIAGGLAGAGRVYNLTDQEKDSLKERYNLDQDANLGLRNAARGVVGGALGMLAGRALGGLAAMRILKNPVLTRNMSVLKKRIPFASAALAGGTLLGAGAGVDLATRKYSKANIGNGVDNGGNAR